MLLINEVESITGDFRVTDVGVSYMADNIVFLRYMEVDGAIAKALGVPQNTMSAHLAILARANLVISERKSRSIIYRADLARFQDLTSFLVEDCCGVRGDLCAPMAECKPARGKRAKLTA